MWDNKVFVVQVYYEDAWHLIAITSSLDKGWDAVEACRKRKHFSEFSIAPYVVDDRNAFL